MLMATVRTLRKFLPRRLDWKCFGLVLFGMTVFSVLATLLLHVHLNRETLNRGVEDMQFDVYEFEGRHSGRDFSLGKLSVICHSIFV